MSKKQPKSAISTSSQAHESINSYFLVLSMYWTPSPILDKKFNVFSSFERYAVFNLSQHKGLNWDVTSGLSTIGPSKIGFVRSSIVKPVNSNLVEPFDNLQNVNSGYVVYDTDWNLATCPNLQGNPYNSKLTRAPPFNNPTCLSSPLIVRICDLFPFESVSVAPVNPNPRFVLNPDVCEACKFAYTNHSSGVLGVTTVDPIHSTDGGGGVLTKHLPLITQSPSSIIRPSLSVREFPEGSVNP